MLTLSGTCFTSSARFSLLITLKVQKLNLRHRSIKCLLFLAEYSVSKVTAAQPFRNSLLNLLLLLLLFKSVKSETKESVIARTNALLVGALISIGDVSVSITIACLFCSDLYLTPLYYCFPVLYKKICFKEGEVWRKTFSNVIIVALVTQGLPSSFQFSAVLLPKFTVIYPMGRPLVRSGTYKMELFFI